MSMKRLFSSLPLTIFGLMAWAPATAQDTGFEAAEPKYDDYIRRPSLWKRAAARVHIAKTRDPRALEILIRGYAKPEQPKEQVRYLIAEVATRFFDREEDLGTLKAWRSSYKKDVDAWLWYRSLATEGWFVDLDELATIARSKADIFLRTAAIEALARNASRRPIGGVVTRLVPDLIKSPPKKDFDRALLFGSCARLLRTQARDIRYDDLKPVCRLLIDQLDDRDLDQHAKIVIARQLAATFECDELGLTSAPWVSKLESPAARPTRQHTVSTRFFGLESIGMRICYVVDASDSMLAPLSDKERKSLGPITGPRQKRTSSGKIMPGKAALPWERIRTRFDAAREFLKLSIGTLSPKQRFSVILFGSEATPLAATNGMVAATKSTVTRVFRELDSISAGPVKADRPHGTLRGNTNMHGGFRCAFRLKKRGLTSKPEYIDKTAYLEGCDTIFLLSDGEPSWDDWPALDKRDPEDNAGDPESQTKQEGTPQLLFQGPFSTPDHLLPDIERLNLFRKAKIHCVGLGEANMHILRGLAMAGLGKAIWIGHE